MKTAAVIPVKTFKSAKTRLELSEGKKTELCKIMLEEVLQTVSVCPKIDHTIVVSKDSEVIELTKKFADITIIKDCEEGVNQAISLADKYLIENNFDASFVLPQDIPCIKIQDIDFLFRFQSPPNFAIIVPSRRFDGTNALVRMPIDLMETHYDEDSYRIHLKTAQKKTRNASLVFNKRIMMDVDNKDDLDFLLASNEKQEISKKILDIIRT